jgi:hypothetical protein
MFRTRSRFFWLISLFLCCKSTLLFGALRTEPWLTQPAIAFLEGFFKENPEAYVLEFGSGASTLWIAQRTPNLYSVEHAPSWYTKIGEKLKESGAEHVHYVLAERPYYTVCDEFPDDFFDLIIVDGRNRKGCIAHSIPKLKPGGILMLDNAERARYRDVIPLMGGWKYVSSEQTKPDAFGFYYRGWRTDWWVKG